MKQRELTETEAFLLMVFMIVIFGLLLLSITSCEPTKAETSNDELLDRLIAENKSLKIENVQLKVYRDEFVQLKSLLDSVTYFGFTPNRLIVFKIQQTYKAWGLDPAIGIRFSSIESSFFANKRRGVLGEVGGFQILPSTFKFYFVQLGGDPTNLYLPDYEHWAINTEWSAYMGYKILEEINKGNITKQKTLDWAKNWNQGKGMK